MQLGIRAQKEGQIAAQAFTVLKKHGLMRVGTYLPIRGEVDLNPLYSIVNREHWPVQWALPVCGADDKLSFSQWLPGSPTVEGHYKIPVPAVSSPMDVQALLIPCVGVHSSGFRLGYGGGWYDRTLSATPEPRPVRIGIAFGVQQNDDWAPELHDQPLDALVTEDGIQWFNTGQV